VARREDHPPPTSRPRGGAGVVFRLSCLTAPAQCMRWRCGAMIGFGPPIGIADRPCEGPCQSPREQPAGSRSLPRDRPPDRRVHGTTGPGHHKHHPTQGELSQRCINLGAPQSLHPFAPHKSSERSKTPRAGRPCWRRERRWAPTDLRRREWEPWSALSSSPDWRQRPQRRWRSQRLICTCRLNLSLGSHGAPPNSCNLTGPDDDRTQRGRIAPATRPRWSPSTATSSAGKGG